MPFRRRTLALVAVLAALQMPSARWVEAADPLDPLLPASTGGIAEIDRDLAKLVAYQRVLVIGAHPDDEDTSLLAYAARGLGAEAAYLALSRGEGGQNVVGPQLGADLGLIRTQELLAARRVDGARQFFTRAFDFGFTSSLDETLHFWPKQDLLLDTVRILRRFRPQVVVSIFPDDGRGGHGQHQAAGLVAHEAFRMAGDPKAFPELAKEGLLPWKPQALYRSAWFNKEEATMVLPLGEASIRSPVSRSVSCGGEPPAAIARSRWAACREMGARVRASLDLGGAGREGTTLRGRRYASASNRSGVAGRRSAVAAAELDLAERGPARRAALIAAGCAPLPLLREVLLHLRLARDRAAGGEDTDRCRGDRSDRREDRGRRARVRHAPRAWRSTPPPDRERRWCRASR